MATACRIISFFFWEEVMECEDFRVYTTCGPFLLTMELRYRRVGFPYAEKEF